MTHSPFILDHSISMVAAGYIFPTLYYLTLLSAVCGLWSSYIIHLPSQFSYYLEVSELFPETS